MQIRNNANNNFKPVLPETNKIEVLSVLCTDLRQWTEPSQNIIIRLI